MDDDALTSTAPAGEAVAWTVLAYLFAGPLVYGALGWLADRWAGTTPLFALVGVVGGVALGLYAGWARYGALRPAPVPVMPTTPVTPGKETS